MTETEMCNRSLGMIGRERINDINDTEDPQALVCKQHYDQARDQVLRDHDWNFALTRTQLAAHVDTPLYNWAYQYPLPPDFIRLVSNNAGLNYPYTVENGRILSDSTTMHIRYVRRIDNPSYMPADVVVTIEALLASSLAAALNHDGKMAQEFYQLYQAHLATAKANDGQEGTPKTWRGTGRYTSIRQF